LAQERISTSFVDKQQQSIVVPIIGFKLWYFTPRSQADFVRQDDIEVCTGVTNAPVVSSGGAPQSEWAAIWANAPKQGAQFLKIWWDYRQDKDVDKVKKKCYHFIVRAQRDFYWYDPTTNEFGMTVGGFNEVPPTARSFSVGGETIKTPAFRFLHDQVYQEEWPDWIPVEP